MRWTENIRIAPKTPTRSWRSGLTQAKQLHGLTYSNVREQARQFTAIAGPVGAKSLNAATRNWKGGASFLKASNRQHQN